MAVAAPLDSTALTLASQGLISWYRKWRDGTLLKRNKSINPPYDFCTVYFQKPVFLFFFFFKLIFLLSPELILIAFKVGSIL